MDVDELYTKQTLTLNIICAVLNLTKSQNFKICVFKKSIVFLYVQIILCSLS